MHAAGQEAAVRTRAGSMPPAKTYRIRDDGTFNEDWTGARKAGDVGARGSCVASG